MSETEEFLCPYCNDGKDWKMKHLLVNHIRQSSGDHGEKYHFPADYKERMGEVTGEENTHSEEGEQSPDPHIEKPTEKPNIPTETKITKVDPPEIPVVKDHKCPDCGTPKTDWINTKEAFKHEINLSYDEIAEFDYVCPECYELIKVK
ncbi:hypothetical protein ES702_07282 [subsurface metagenome]